MTTETLRARRMRRALVAVAAMLTIGAIAVTIALMNPLPPRTVVMATDAEGGVYVETARRYQAVMARNRVRLELRVTRGAVDNLKLLGDPRSGVSVAFVQGGLKDATKTHQIVSLGTVFYEPLWNLVRGTVEPGGYALDRRSFIGQPGSGTRALAEELLPALGYSPSAIDAVDMTAAQAGEAMLRGELNRVVMVSAWEAPIVHRLLTAPGVTILPALRADAHVALRPYLTKLTLPRGVADLARDIPPVDVSLLAAKTSLLVREDLHPAIQYLLLEAAAEVNSAPSVFSRAGQFPAAEPIDVPLSEAARQYYHSGRPFLQRTLPFWLASFSSQILVLLIPVVGVVYPIFRLLPVFYGWTMRRRIFRLYGELKLIETEFEGRGSGLAGPELSVKLGQLEQRADHMHVSRAFSQMLYTLRQHIELVRMQIARSDSAARR